MLTVNLQRLAWPICASAVSQGFAVTGADFAHGCRRCGGWPHSGDWIGSCGHDCRCAAVFHRPFAICPDPRLRGVADVRFIFALDTRTLREIWSIDRAEVGLAVITTLGVVAVGAINGILIAVGLALVRFVKLTARPKDEVLGAVDGLPGFHSIERHPDAKTFPGLTLYRFDGPLTFFNSDYFKQRAPGGRRRRRARTSVVGIDAIPISQIDITGLYALRDLRERLEARGTALILAGRKTEFLTWLREAGLYRPEHERGSSRHCARP